MLNVSIAENHARKTDSGWEETGTSYYRIVRWAGATNSTEVEAIAASRTYADKTTGEARSSTELIADEIAASFKGVTEIAVTRQTRASASTTADETDRTDEPPF